MRCLENKKIFILEKSALICEVLREELERYSAQIRIGDASDYALLKVIRWCPDLLVTGVDVGVINGFDLSMILRQIPKHQDMKIVLVDPDANDIVDCTSSGMEFDFCLPKDDNLILNVRKLIPMIFNVQLDEEIELPRSKRTPGKVLVVDDSSVMRSIISDMLESMGVSEICHAINGKDALAQLENHHIGLVLTDWNMPMMDGLTFIKHLRSNSAYDLLPVVMVTTENVAEDVELARSVGANGHIPKPFTREKIRDMINCYPECIVRSID